MAVPKPPLFPVTSRAIDIAALVQRADGGSEKPYPVYEFGGNRKAFMSNLQSGGIYDKPVSFSAGVTTHLPDPSLISTNP